MTSKGYPGRESKALVAKSMPELLGQHSGTVSESVTVPMGSDLLALAEGVATVVILT